VVRAGGARINYEEVLPFVFCQFLTILVLLALPELALILPRAMI